MAKSGVLLVSQSELLWGSRVFLSRRLVVLCLAWLLLQAVGLTASFQACFVVALLLVLCPSSATALLLLSRLTLSNP